MDRFRAPMAGSSSLAAGSHAWKLHATTHLRRHLFHFSAESPRRDSISHAIAGGLPTSVFPRVRCGEARSTEDSVCNSALLPFTLTCPDGPQTGGVLLS